MAGGLGMSTNLDHINLQMKQMDKSFAAAVKKNLRAAVAESGVELVSAIRAEAAWSSRIPGATSIATTFGVKAASIRVRVDKRKAPHARPLEMGNSTTFSEKVINANGGFKTVNGRRVAVNRSVYKAMKQSGVGVGRELRHPVFGRGGYSSMPIRPFFFAAVDARTPAIDQRFNTCINKIALDAGFKGV